MAYLPLLMWNYNPMPTWITQHHLILFEGRLGWLEVGLPPSVATWTGLCHQRPVPAGENWQRLNNEVFEDCEVFSLCSILRCECLNDAKQLIKCDKRF